MEAESTLLPKEVLIVVVIETAVLHVAVCGWAATLLNKEGRPGGAACQPSMQPQASLPPPNPHTQRAVCQRTGLHPQLRCARSRGPRDAGRQWRH